MSRCPTASPSPTSPPSRAPPAPAPFPHPTPPSLTRLARRRGLHIDGRRPVGSLPGQPNFANFVDLQESVSVKPFQNFLFISLNDQRVPGCGQTHLLPGGHIAIEEFFKWQLATFGRVGSMCEGWNMEHPRGIEPKPWPHAGIPTMVRQYFTQSDETSVTAPDGTRWPKPVPLLLGPGDAAIASYAIPHAPSPNERGDERQQMIFRCTLPGIPKGGQPGHPIPESECEEWRAQLLDCWRGWEGMREVAARERPSTEPARAELQRIFREHGPTA